MDKRAAHDHPIHDLIADRWSPYGFDGSSVAAADLRSLFEAARWAPSSYNEQPWVFFLARREDGALFERFLGCLVEANRVWARRASALVLTAVRTRFAHNGKPNAMARHDLGLAMAGLSVEATARGLLVHQMGGILPDEVRKVCGLPEDVEPVTAAAVGRSVAPDALPEDLRARDTADRRRRPLAEIVHGGSWGEAAAALEG